MKFKVVSESKRTLERVFDAGLLLAFIGILLQRDVSGDFIFFGTMLLSWCIPCFVLQKGWIENRLRNQIFALVFIIVVFVMFVEFIIVRM